MAANSELRAAVRGARRGGLGPAGRALHRQRRDDRRRGALPRAGRRTRTTSPSTRRRGSSAWRSSRSTASPAATCATRPARSSSGCARSGASSSTRWTCRSTRALHRALRRADPGTALDGEELFEFHVEEAVLLRRLDRVDGREVRRPHSGRRRAATGSAGWRAGGLGAALARGGGPAVAIPAGADPGQEDGAGDDLLPGAGRLHARQLHPDPARPVRLRQVRQARGGLQRRLAASRRSARSCGPPASTTSRCSARATSARRSRARTSSPTTASASWRCSTRTRARSAARWATA